LKKIRTRFAPSPTGYLHIGGIRTALFSWLYARHHKGTFILRVEDTDRERSTPEAIEIILNGMEWLGLHPDEGPFYQSHRFDRYRGVIQQLLQSGNAYYCYCSKEELEQMRSEAMARGDKPKYDGTCRHRTTPPEIHGSPVVRFKTPDSGDVIIEDLIQGRVVYRNTELDDLIISRSDGVPTYNLTVVVDDMDMEITHVIRGDDHLNNTPRQINIFNALEVIPPEYAHIPLILSEDGKKLSKRHGAASVLEYREKGYLPEALLNYLVRLGWSHGDQEIFSIDEMVGLFDIADVNKSAAAINSDKLLWLNQHYLRECDGERLAPLLKQRLESYGISTEQGPAMADLCNIQKERVKTLEEMALQSRYFYEDFTMFDDASAKKHLGQVVLEPFIRLHSEFASLQDWSNTAIHQVIEQVAAVFQMKLGKIAQPLRVAVTGIGVSPSIDATIVLIGKERVLQRLELAIAWIKARSELDSGDGVT
jgi:glutamyl-tRNA synthetase